jgi:hypothetical protein
MLLFSVTSYYGDAIAYLKIDMEIPRRVVVNKWRVHVWANPCNPLYYVRPSLWHIKHKNLTHKEQLLRLRAISVIS